MLGQVKDDNVQKFYFQSRAPYEDKINIEGYFENSYNNWTMSFLILMHIWIYGKYMIK